MKNFLFHNDKNKVKDEFYLFLFILVCIGVGVLMYIFAPTNWIISDTSIKAFGVLWIIVGVMFIPGFIYRLFTNDTATK